MSASSWETASCLRPNSPEPAPYRLSFSFLQIEEEIAYLRFLCCVLRNMQLATDASVYVSNVPAIFKKLQKRMRLEPALEIISLIPEIYFHICVVSMEFPIPGITVPLMVNEFFSLFKSPSRELRSFACRYGAMLFSELVGERRV